MKQKIKTASKILTILVGLAAVSAYIWYTYDYIFGIDQSGRTKWILWIISIAVLILPWEVLIKLLFRLLNNLTKQIFKLSQRLIKSINETLKRVRLQNEKPVTRSIFIWLLLVVFANTINYFIIRKLPIGYDFRIGFNFLVLLVGIFLARKIIRSFFSGLYQVLDDRISINLEKNFLRKPNIIKLTTYLILIGGALMVMESWIYKPEARFALWGVELNEEYDNQIRSRIEIDNLDLGNQTIDGYIEINEYGKYTDMLIDSVKSIAINDQIIPLEVLYVKDFGIGTRSFKSGRFPFQVKLYGDSYLFPFVDYGGEIKIGITGNWSPFLQPDMDTSIYSQIDSVNLIRGETSHTTYTDDISNEYSNVFTYRFKLIYTPYFKVLFITVFLVLFVFLLAIWKTKKMDQVMGLSIGIFATLYTIKGWVIPNEIISQSSPLLFDRISLIYIVVFLASLLYKYSNQSD